MFFINNYSDRQQNKQVKGHLTSDAAFNEHFSIF